MNIPDPESTAHFVQLLTGMQSRLYAYLCTLLARPEDARDALQETNLVLWKKVSEYDPKRPFEAWAFRFAHFQALAWRKRQSRDRLVFDDTTFEALSAEFPSAGSAESELRRLEECLGKLPEKQRALVERRYSGGESVNLIAEVESKAPNAIAALLYRARKMLADCMGAWFAAEGGVA